MPLEDAQYEHSADSYWRPAEVAPVDLHRALPWDRHAPAGVRMCEREGRVLLSGYTQLRHLLGVDLYRLPEPGPSARLLHLRQALKMRRPDLGFFEWRIVRRGLRAARKPRCGDP